MVFSEDSRVKIPCILHLIRLGYQYLSLYEKLTARSGSRLTDFSNNSFHVVTELTHKNGGGNWVGSVGILYGESMAEEMKLFLKGQGWL